MTNITESIIVEPPTGRDILAYVGKIIGKGNLMPLVLQATSGETEHPAIPVHESVIFKLHQTTHLDDGSIILTGEELYEQGSIRIETSADLDQPATANSVSHDLFD